MNNSINSELTDIEERINHIAKQVNDLEISLYIQRRFLKDVIEAAESLKDNQNHVKVEIERLLLNNRN